MVTQADDDALEKLAQRVRARAIRRCGKLLKQIEDKNRGRRLKEIHTGNGTNLSRKAAAEEAGLSKRQKDTALRMASIPVEDFEEAIESTAFYSLSQVAQRPIPHLFAFLSPVLRSLYPIGSTSFSQRAKEGEAMHRIGRPFGCYHTASQQLARTCEEVLS